MDILFDLSKTEQTIFIGIALGMLVILIIVIILLVIKLKKSKKEVYNPIKEYKEEEKKEDNISKFDIETTANMIEESLENKDGDDVTRYELEQEERSIISYEELKRLAQEQKESGVKVVSFDDEEKKTPKEYNYNTEILDFAEEINETKFKPSEFVSPINGIESKDINNDILNIEKLGDDIKNSNEFLEALKELKKSLD